MGARAWSIEHYIPSIYNGTSASVHCMMWSLYNFFVGLTSSIPQLGLSILARQHGNQQNYPGTGLVGPNRFDQPNFWGSNSFFVVRFASASNPFEILFQMRTVNGAGSTNALLDFGATPGNPGKLEGAVFQTSPAQTEAYILGWAVGMRLDGSRSWNGTVNNNGSDTKASPVWTGSLSGGLYIFPRNNNVQGAGAFGTNRENCMWLNRPSANATAPVRWHMYCDADTFFFTQDFSDDGTYDRYCYFGPYQPITSAVTMPPYMCFADSGIFSNRQYGYRAATNPIDTTNYPNGGICHPVASGSGTMQLMMGANNTYSSPMFPGIVYGGPGKIFNHYLTVNVNDTGATEQGGFCGIFDRIPYTIGPRNNDVSGSITGSGLVAAFGNSSTNNTFKVYVPWPTGTVNLPGTNTTTMFNGRQIVEIF